MAVGRFNGLPLNRTAMNRLELFDKIKFLFTSQIVAYIVIVDGCRLSGFGRILYEESYCYRSARATSENLATLFARQLTACALVATKIEDVNVRKLGFKASTESILCVAVKP